MEKEPEAEVLKCKLGRNGQFELKPRCISGLTIGGLIVGFASGLFGVGGGFLIVPMIRLLGEISMQKAIATSLATITVISGSGFISHFLLSSTVSMNMASIRSEYIIILV